MRTSQRSAVHQFGNPVLRYWLLSRIQCVYIFIHIFFSVLPYISQTSEIGVICGEGGSFRLIFIQYTIEPTAKTGGLRDCTLTYDGWMDIGIIYFPTYLFQTIFTSYPTFSLIPIKLFYPKVLHTSDDYIFSDSILL